MAQEAKPRICKECKRLLPIEAFERNRPSVWRSECKECRASKKAIPAKIKRAYEQDTRCWVLLGCFAAYFAQMRRAFFWGLKPRQRGGCVSPGTYN